MNTKRPTNAGQRDTIEKDVDTSLTGFGSSLVKNLGQSFGDLGGGIFDQLSGNPTTENQNRQEQQPFAREQQSAPAFRPESFSIFDRSKLEEQRQIEQLMEVVKKEIDAIQQQGQEFAQDIKDVQNILINERKGNSEGIYHVRFLEAVISLLRTIRMKLGESRTWMEALMSKKAKRGSLFASRSKKQGTQYSQSEEMKMARSGQ